MATTSRLLSTGVDVEDLKFVVLFRPVGSMVEFKQIIGRGTRLFPDKGKTSFEIIDYVGATVLFEDPAFDAYPTDITREVVDADGEVVGADAVVPDAQAPVGTEPLDDPWVEEPVPAFAVHDQPGAEPGIPPGRKLYVDDRQRPPGRPPAGGLESRPARTRSERVGQVREQHAAEFAAQTEEARAVLEGLLARYEEFGVTDLETTEVFRLAPLGELGSPVDLAQVFGGGESLRAQLDRVQKWLYARKSLVRLPGIPLN